MARWGKKGQSRRKLSASERLDCSQSEHFRLQFEALKKGDPWLEKYHKTCINRQEWDRKILPKEDRRSIFNRLMLEKSWESDQKRKEGY